MFAWLYRVRTLPVVAVQMFVEKIKSDENNRKSGRDLETLSAFVCNHMLFKFGTRTITQVGWVGVWLSLPSSLSSFCLSLSLSLSLSLLQQPERCHHTSCAACAACVQARLTTLLSSVGATFERDRLPYFFARMCGLSVRPQVHVSVTSACRCD